ncbi:MAG TPA: helix-turn-helix domain-containing protein [Solirubrobacteraceae bacterium]|nr:helix-turn-helix domain-containing protein [Solirubrobacteraceae bacterium]
MVDGRRLRGEATRERILATARRLFGERGYEATSIELVLESSGVARGALYHHFASKAELFDAVAEEVFVEIAARADEAAAAAGRDMLDRFRAGARAWLEMAIDPAVQRIALTDPLIVLGWQRWRALDEKHSLGSLRAGFAVLESEGRVPAGESELLANLLLAALNEAALFIASAKDQQAALATARRTIDALLARLAPATVA